MFVVASLSRLQSPLVVDRNSGFGFGRNWTFGELLVSTEIILLVTESEPKVNQYHCKMSLSTKCFLAKLGASKKP